MRPGVPPCLFIDEERSICIHFQFPNPLSGTAEKAVDRAPGSQSTKITPPRLLRGLSTHFKAGFPHLPLGWRNYSQCHTSSAQQLATDPGAPVDTQQSTRCLTVSHTNSGARDLCTSCWRTTELTLNAHLLTRARYVNCSSLTQHTLWSGGHVLSEMWPSCLYHELPGKLHSIVNTSEEQQTPLPGETTTKQQAFNFQLILVSTGKPPEMECEIVCPGVFGFLQGQNLEGLMYR